MALTTRTSRSTRINIPWPFKCARYISRPALNLLGTVSLVYIFSMTWGLLQERIAVQPYGASAERFPSILVLNIAQSISAWAIASMIIARRYTSRELEKLPPVSAFLPVSCIHTAASPVMYTALHFLSYPHVTLISSVKLVPMMVAGALLNGKRYTRRDVTCALLMTLGVGLYSAEKAMHNGAAASAGPQSPETGAIWSPAELAARLSPGYRVLVGALLVLTNLSMDGAVGAAQDAVQASHNQVHQRHPLPPVVMMRGQNGWATTLLATYLLLDWAWYRGSGLVPSCMSFFSKHPSSLLHLAGFAACGCAAQVVIFASLASNGSFTTTSITLSRKFFSILLSTLVYRHSLSGAQWAGISLVFSGLVIQLSSVASGPSKGQGKAGIVQDGKVKRRESDASEAGFEDDEEWGSLGTSSRGRDDTLGSPHKYVSDDLPLGGSIRGALGQGPGARALAMGLASGQFYSVGSPAAGRSGSKKRE